MENLENILLKIKDKHYSFAEFTGELISTSLGGNFGNCDTGATNKNKVACLDTLPVLSPGVKIFVKFDNGHTLTANKIGYQVVDDYPTLTLKKNGSDSSVIEKTYPIKVEGNFAGENFVDAGATHELLFTGDSWDDLTATVIYRGVNSFGSYCVYRNSMVDDNITRLNNIYPVGSIYETLDNDFDPNINWGGTWDKVENAFLLGASSRFVAGLKGGEESHKLVINELPSHSHTFTGTAVNSGYISHDHTHSGYTSSDGNHYHGINVNIFGNPDGWRDYGRNYWSNNWDRSGMTTDYAGSHSHSFTTGGVSSNHYHSVTAAGTNSYTGSSLAHNNMPPYLAVHIWRRTA